MPDLPLVSIIIPLYNAGPYIAETLESAIQQTWLHTEILVVDDGSTDDGFEVARQYESKTVKVMHQQNQGPAAARNHGLKLARGKYIQFLDADDFLSPDKIEAQMSRLEKNPESLCFCRTTFFDDGADPSSPQPSENEVLNRDYHDPVEFLVTLLGGYPHIGGMIQPNAWLTPRSLVDRAGPWNEALHPNPDDDGEFFFRVIMQSRQVLFSERGINYYRKFRGKTLGYSSPYKNPEALGNLYKTIAMKESLLFRHNDGERAKKCIAKQYTDLMITSFPHDKTISRSCQKRLREIGPYYYLPTMGGRSLELIKNLMGWKTAKYVSWLAGTVRHSLQS